MRIHSRCRLAAVLLALCLAYCAGEPNPVPEYLKNTWGIRLSGFSGDYEVGGDGTQIYTSTGKTSVDGLGEKEVLVQTTVQPVAQGGEVVAYVSNPDGSEERYFVYDQSRSDIEIGSPAQGVAVALNPDGTYQVWTYARNGKEGELQVPNGFEALKIVAQYNELKTISPYIFLTAFALAHTSAPEARAPNSAESNAAATPVVCELFKEFCDCAACLVLNRQGTCARCPKL